MLIPILRHHLEQALLQGLDVVARSPARARIAGEQLVAAQRRDRLEREVRVDRARAVADEQRQVRDLARLARLDDEADAHARALADQVVVHRRGREQARDGRVPRVDVAIAEDEDARAVVDRAARRARRARRARA